MDHVNDFNYLDDGKRKKRNVIKGQVNTSTYEHKQTRAIKNESESCFTTVASCSVSVINLFINTRYKTCKQNYIINLIYFILALAILFIRKDIRIASVGSTPLK